MRDRLLLLLEAFVPAQRWMYTKTAVMVSDLVTKSVHIRDKVTPKTYCSQNSPIFPLVKLATVVPLYLGEYCTLVARGLTL